MSNLKLPTLTRDNLVKLIQTARHNPVGHSGKSIGYQTGIATSDWETHRTILLYHHTTAIASFWEGAGNFRITNGGYGSSTTRNRLNMVLKDNGSDWRITQTDFTQVLVNIKSGHKFPHFTSARFEDNILVAFNEQGI